MANIQNFPLDIMSEPSSYSLDPIGYKRYGVYSFGNGPHLQGQWVHLKTNVRHYLGGYIMVMMELEGHSYATGRMIDVRNNFYVYNDGRIFHTNGYNLGPGFDGLSYSSTYPASDDCVVVSYYFHAGAAGDSSFTVNSICANPTGARFPFEILDSTLHNAATGAY